MTVLENLLVAQHSAADAGLGLHDPRAARPARPTATRRPRRSSRAKAWLERIDLMKRADDPAGALPYGAQRRLEIARAMCTDPVLLCLDEPAAGLNPRESAELNGLLRHIRDEHDTSVLLIEHDMSRGDGDLRPRGRARLRPEDRRRLAPPMCGPTRRSSPPISASRTRRSRPWRPRSGSPCRTGTRRTRERRHERRRHQRPRRGDAGDPGGTEAAAPRGARRLDLLRQRRGPARGRSRREPRARSSR